MKKVVTSMSLEYKSTAWNGREPRFVEMMAGFLLYCRSDVLTVRAIGWLVPRMTSALLAELCNLLFLLN